SVAAAAVLLAPPLRTCPSHSPNRASRNPVRTWRPIWQHGYRPTNGKQLSQCFGRDQPFHNWIGDRGGSYVSPERTDLDPGAAYVGGNDLIGERDAHRVQVYVPCYCVDIARLNSI